MNRDLSCILAKVFEVNVPTKMHIYYVRTYTISSFYDFSKSIFLLVGNNGNNNDPFPEFYESQDKTKNAIANKICQPSFI